MMSIRYNKTAAVSTSTLSMAKKHIAQNNDIERITESLNENDISYDAVHFTQKGHDIVMSICSATIQF